MEKSLEVGCPYTPVGKATILHLSVPSWLDCTRYADYYRARGEGYVMEFTPPLNTQAHTVISLMLAGF